MKDRIATASSDQELNYIGIDISCSLADDSIKKPLYDLIEDRRKQLNTLMADIGDITLSDVIGDYNHD